MPFDSEIFDEMKNIALDVLRDREKNEYAQAIVLQTTKGNKYAAFIENVLSSEKTKKTEEKNLIGRLVNAKDTKIDFVLSLWQSGEIDIPSHDFRKMLYNLNSANSDAEIFVLTGSGYSAVELERTL